MKSQNRLAGAGAGAGRGCLDLTRESKQRPSHHSSIPTHAAKHCRHRAVRRKTLLRSRSSSSSSSQQLFLLLIFLTCCISLSSAKPVVIYVHEQLVEGPVQTRPIASGAEALGSASLSGYILVDQNMPPTSNSHDEEHDHDHDLPRGANELKKRAEQPRITSSSPSSSSTLPPTSTKGGIVAAVETGVKPMPRPFDMGFNNNITADCASFMSNMLSNSTFQSCLPFSILLQNSQTFFAASKSLVRITQVLDNSCAANVTLCTNVLSSFATNITKPTSCATDLSSRNPIIQQALLGLKSYKPLYTASCLRNPDTSAYCFADAITNATNPTDSHVYFLPLNISLVGGSQPTCDSCLQNTMAIFEQASSDRTQALASTYVRAATQININCGPQFVNASLPAPVESSAAMPSLHTNPAGSVALLAVLIAWLL
ncbi:uncharacterized protein RAG0_01153 [Rhynchosporium agropyri]|uniref:DUF7729 domain-containing protein n=1 Tax=Rhynchosporium agropyri TaxID=914238 RepID=A0A1E1JVV8_9HELO|nr:uncharacterized protein RAG0_01153 [Rhynchosporium agropyri]